MKAFWRVGLVAILLAMMCASFFPAQSVVHAATTYHIAAVDSSAPDKAAANAVCDGTADQVEINTYLTSGNIVILYAGTYNINGNVNVASSSHLYGQGNTSVVNSQGGGISILNVSNVEVDHLRITGAVNPVTINASIFISANTTSVSGISVHDITDNATGVDGVNLYVKSHPISDVVFSRVAITDPSGFGFVNLGNGLDPTNNVITNVTYYQCSVTNAGTGGGSPWATGFNLIEGATGTDNLTVNGVYVIDSWVNGAWESAFHMEGGSFHSNNVVFTGDNATNAGQKPGFTYGFGYLINGDTVVYGNTASSNGGGDERINATTYTPMVDAISPSSSTKTAASVLVGNCRGVNIATDTTHRTLVLYSDNGSPVSQQIDLGGIYYSDDGNSYVFSGTNLIASFTDYSVIKLVGEAVSSIAVTPNPAPALAEGLTQQFTATATFSDNTQGNVTSSVTWYSANPVVAPISATGLVTGAVSGGSTTIFAVLGGVYSNNVALSIISGSTPSPVPVTPPTYTSGTVTNPSTVAFGTGASPMYNVFNNVLENGDWLVTAEGFVQYNLATSLTVYPTGTGVQAGLISSNNSTNYVVVSDNSDATYVYTNSTSYVRDLYTVNTVTQYTGTITAVSVHARIASNSTDLAYVVPELYVNGNVYSGSAQTAGTAFATKNQVWYSSPATGLPWTWTEIKSLQAGASLATASASSVAKMSELSVVVSYTATDPGYSAKNAFWFEMLDTVGAGSGQIIYATLQEYGDRPIGMYVSANQSSVLHLTVGTSYQLRIRGNPLIFTSSANNSATVTLAATDYIDQSLSDNDTNFLRDNMMQMAWNIQHYDQPSSANAYIEPIRGIDYLTEAGANIFLRGIPYLDTMCPPLFKATKSVLDANAPTGSGSYAASLTATAQWGGTVATALTNLGTYFGINQQLAGAAVLFVLGIGFSIFIYTKTESGLAVLLVIVALPIVGAWLGLMNMALAFVMIILCVVLLGYFFVARGAL